MVNNDNAKTLSYLSEWLNKCAAICGMGDRMLRRGSEVRTGSRT